MQWIWLVVIALYVYHGWCLQSGRVRFNRSDGVTRRSAWLRRDENPMLFWIVWAVGVVTTTVFAGYLGWGLGEGP